MEPQCAVDQEEDEGWPLRGGLGAAGLTQAAGGSPEQRRRHCPSGWGEVRLSLDTEYRLDLNLEASQGQVF